MIRWCHMYRHCQSPLRRPLSMTDMRWVSIVKARTSWYQKHLCGEIGNSIETPRCNEIAACDRWKKKALQLPCEAQFSFLIFNELVWACYVLYKCWESMASCGCSYSCQLSGSFLFCLSHFQRQADLDPLVEQGRQLLASRTCQLGTLGYGYSPRWPRQVVFKHLQTIKANLKTKKTKETNMN